MRSRPAVEVGERASGLAHQDVERRRGPTTSPRAPRRCRRRPRRPGSRTRSRRSRAPATPRRSDPGTVRRPSARPAVVRSENDRLADATSSTEDTDTRRVSRAPTDVNAPSPLPAHHRRCNAGALTTPTMGTPSSSNAINVAHTGTPRTKLLVPSIGSSTHWRPAKTAVPPNSSPSTTSSGRSWASVSRSIGLTPNGRRRSRG